ncbi:hypothetical protein BX666DRAFT_2029875 [Dichotomocladium elegans]|nr:hypothetical protein BX666DRAFT_2029875 [Dichotomocladium elegans]
MANLLVAGASVLTGVILYRPFGGFYYRTCMTLLCTALCALYGVFASLILPVLGRSDLLNWSVARSFYYLTSFFVGISVTVEGDEHIDPSRPAVYVCNHQATLDIMLMSKVYPKATAIVAKKALKYYPFLGWYMILSKAIFLDRKNRQNAIKAARDAAENIHKNKTNVWLFPEGTRGHPSKIDLLPFKKGAFYMGVQARVPIVPIVIANYNNLYDSKAKRFLPGVVRVKVLPPVSTADVAEDSAAIDKLSTSIREDMLTALKEISPVDKKAQ